MVLESKTLEDKARELLADRGVSLQDIGELVMFLQKDYIEGITLEMCIESVNAVLSKREVHNTILTGVQLDILAEENQLLHPLQEIVKEDEGLYGIDEILALSIVNVYGSIGFTNYGYIDKVKPGILKEKAVKADSHQKPENQRQNHPPLKGTNQAPLLLFLP